MNRKKQLIGASILLATFVLALPTLTPHVSAGPVTEKCVGCGITMLSPGSNGALNNQSTVGPTFLVSFALKNFLHHSNRGQRSGHNPVGSNERTEL